MILFSMLAVLFVTGAKASECINSLQSEIMSQPNSRVVGFKDGYVCSTNNSCAVFYEVDSSPYPNSIILAYRDTDKDMNVPWIIKNHESVWQGWELFGKYGCADVKTYVTAKNADQDTMSVSVIKRTAYDTMFCASRKVYFQYDTNCKKI